MSDIDRSIAIVPTEFTVDQEQDADGSFKLVEWVSWQKKGNPNSGGRDKVRRLQKHEPAIWEAIKPYYEAWKKNEEAPIDGTPLEVWPLVNKQMAKSLKMNGFRSVEDLAQATDADLERIGMMSGVLREKARQYVADKKDISALAKRDARIEELEKKLEELASKLDQPKEVKKRGRKPKGVKDVAIDDDTGLRG